MGTHSSIFAWEIPWTEEPGGLQSMGSQRVGHNWATSPYIKLNNTFMFNEGHLLNTSYENWVFIRLKSTLRTLKSALFSVAYLFFTDSVRFSSVQSLSHVRLFATSWITARQASLSITNSRSSLNSLPLNRWCHPAISSSVVPFSSCPQPLPTSGSFPVSHFFTWGGQSIGVSASAKLLRSKNNLIIV